MVRESGCGNQTKVFVVVLIRGFNDYSKRFFDDELNWNTIL